MKLWPFASKTAALKDHLTNEIKNLQNQLDERELDEEAILLEGKSLNTLDSTSVGLGGMFGVADEYYDKGTLQRMYASETWFYIAVNAIVKSLTALPIKVQRKKMVNQSIKQEDGSIVTVKKETWVDASGEPEQNLLKYPNSIQNPIEFWSLIFIDLLSTGDAFIFLDKGDAQDDMLQDNNLDRLRRAMDNKRTCKIRNLYRLNSSLVKPTPSEEDNRILAGYWIQTDYGTFDFEADEVIHIKFANPNDPFYGLAPIIAVMKRLLLDSFSTEHMMRFYKQGARLGGVINTEKKLTKDQLTRLERIFESNFTGKRNHHKTLILPEGMKYQTIEQNPGETSLIEFLKANKEPILSAYGVPPIQVGLLDGATFANANIQDKTYYSNTIIPICTLIQSALNLSPIFPNIRGLRCIFDLSEIEALKENETEKSSAAKGMLDSGLTVNEVREKVWKLAPLTGGNKSPVIEKMSKPANPFFFPGKSNKPEETKDVLNVQNDTQALSDVKPTETTFEDRVGQIVGTAIQNGIDPAIAVREAIQQAMIEGFVPSREPLVEQKTLNPEEMIHGFKKSELIAFQKATTGEGINEIITEREKEVEQFFKRLEELFNFFFPLCD